MQADRLGQAAISDDVIDLGLGHPDPDLLPVAELQAAASVAFDRYGSDVLSYGAAAGPPPTIAFICERLAVVDARGPSSDEVVITAGNSHGLEQAVTMTARPGDAVLVEAPTYHLALRILRDHPVEIVPVASDPGGLVVGAAAEAIAAVRARGVTPRLLYTVPRTAARSAGCRGATVAVEAQAGRARPVRGVTLRSRRPRPQLLRCSRRAFSLGSTTRTGSPASIRSNGQRRHSSTTVWLGDPSVLANSTTTQSCGSVPRSVHSDRPSVWPPWQDLLSLLGPGQP